MGQLLVQKPLIFIFEVSFTSRHPTSKSPSKKPTKLDSSAKTLADPDTISIFSFNEAVEHTFVEKKPPSLNPSKVNKENHESNPHSQPRLVSSVAHQLSTM